MSLVLFLSVAMASSPIIAHEATLEVGPQAGALVIHSAKTRFDLDQNKGWFTGDVQATRGDMSLTASEAEVTLGADGSITRAVARGQVVVTQGEHRATGEGAIMEGDTLTLSGDPLLTSAKHRMRGSEMVFQVGEKTVRCTECTVVVEER